jgi:transposase
MTPPIDQLFPLLKFRTDGEVRELVCVLEACFSVQQQALEAAERRIVELEARVRELEGQLKKDSTNSGKPPSSDGLKRKTRSLREKSGRRQGGQEGHKGKGLKFSATPDAIEIVPRKKACECGGSLHDADVTGVERRQVVDVPKVVPTVTEYRGERVQCSCCKQEHGAEFPGHVTPGVSYGTNIRAVVLLLLNEHLIPYARVAELCEELFGLPVSVGSLVSFQEECFEALEQEEKAIKEEIIQSDTVSFDETGMRCEKKTIWCHSASTENSTHYAVHEKRGVIAMKEIDILPRFQGTAVHDHWSSYFSFSCVHALCNAHHLRELKFLVEVEKESWAQEIGELLKEALHEVHVAQGQGALLLSESAQAQISSRYHEIITAGFVYHASLGEFDTGKEGKQGKKKQRPGKNLLDRLLNRKDDVLRFIADLRVPFTNNLGERDLRMNKVKQKISGCFRTLAGARMFCRIRGFISTAKKRGLSVLDVVTKVLNGQAVFAPTAL